MSQERILLENKIQSLVTDNTQLTIELNGIKEKLRNAETDLLLKDREIVKERELSILIRDCVVLFAHSSSTDKLVSHCVKYLRNYFNCSSVVFYMRSEWVGSKDGNEYQIDPMRFMDIYPFPFESSDMPQTDLDDVEDLLQQMSYSQQAIKFLTSMDLKMLANPYTKTALFCKLKHGNQVYGYVLIEYTQETSVSSDGFLNLLLELFTSNYTNLLMNKMIVDSYNGAKQQAYVDMRTGCYNNRKLAEDLENMGETSYTLISVDIDNFKGINDTYGHDVGDDVLRYFGTKFESYMVQLGGHAYREGGDEFIGISYMDLDSTVSIVRALTEEVWGKTIHAGDGQLFNITNSIGIYQRKSGETVEVVKKKVDINMYVSKNNGKKQFTVNQDIEL